MSLPSFGLFPPDLFPPDLFGPGPSGPTSATQYHVYGNGGSGGPIDYGTPLATVSLLTWTSPALLASSDWAFGVRAFDPISLLEEANVDARVRILIDAARADITARPLAPLGLTALPRAAGAIRVHWVANYTPDPTALGATGYHVYLGTPTVNLVTPAATVLDTGARDYTANVPGLVDGAVYQVCVRAYNATGEEKNANFVSVTADASGPAAVDGLTGSATFEQGS